MFWFNFVATLLVHPKMQMDSPKHLLQILHLSLLSEHPINLELKNFFYYFDADINISLKEDEQANIVV